MSPKLWLAIKIAVVPIAVAVIAAIAPVVTAWRTSPVAQSPAPSPPPGQSPSVTGPQFNAPTTIGTQNNIGHQTTNNDNRRIDNSNNTYNTFSKPITSPTETENLQGSRPTPVPERPVPFTQSNIGGFSTTTLPESFSAGWTYRPEAVRKNRGSNEYAPKESWLARIAPRDGRFFADGTYYIIAPFKWEEEGTAPNKRHVSVPNGFVTRFESAPTIFWSIISPNPDFLYPLIVHDYLYWSQDVDRNTADLTLVQMLKELNVPAKSIERIYESLLVQGKDVWTEYGRMQRSGEKRFLRQHPPDPDMTWDAWRLMPGAV